MGVDYYAYTIIGLRVPIDKIIGTVIKHKNKCECEPQTEPMAGQKFCGKCGCVLDYPYKADDPRFGVDIWEIEEKGIGGWPVVSDGDYGTYFYIGLLKASGEDKGPTKIPYHIEGMKNKFQKDMEELGLWDEDSYGIWTVLQISC